MTVERHIYIYRERERERERERQTHKRIDRYNKKQERKKR
jgi:hypothetical protein